MSSAATATPQPVSVLQATLPLAYREVIRFLRQRSRVMGAIGQPIIFWILFGAGMSGAFQMPGVESETGLSFQEYFLPGIAVLIVLFTSIFSSISVIQDRNDGFLQGVLVAPAPRTAIVLGKVLGGSILALLQALVFVLLAPLFSIVKLAPEMQMNVSPVAILTAAFYLALVSIGLTALGYFFAWKINSVQGYHGVMSMVLLPMWLLSGAFFPGTGSVWMKWLIMLNPLTYGVAGLRRCLATDPAILKDMPPFWLCMAVTILFAVVTLALDIWVTRKDTASAT